MSSLQRLVITSSGTTADFKSVCPLSTGGLDSLNSFTDYLGALAGGNQMALLQFQVGTAYAYGTLTVATGGSSDAQTCSVCGVTFTAKSSGATGNQFNVSATAATQASNMAAAFNASSNLTGIVRAAAVGGVVTLTALVPGVIGNGLGLSAGNLSNVTAAAFANGSDGTAYSIDLR